MWLIGGFRTSGSYTYAAGRPFTVGSGGTTGLTLTGGPITTSGTLTLGGTLIVANGGTGRASHTAYAVICGGTTTTAAQQSVASAGTKYDTLTSQGAGALPSFSGYPAAAIGLGLATAAL